MLMELPFKKYTENVIVITIILLITDVIKCNQIDQRFHIKSYVINGYKH